MSEEYRDPWLPDNVEDAEDLDPTSEVLFSTMIGMIASTKRQNGSQLDAWHLIDGLRRMKDELNSLRVQVEEMQAAIKRGHDYADGPGWLNDQQYIGASLVMEQIEEKLKGEGVE